MDANSRGLHKFPVTVKGMAVMPQGESWRKSSDCCNSSSPCCSLHKPEWGFPSSALRYVSLSVLAGFYPVNHTDCLQSQLHHCFDGITGELAHAFFPPTGEIHFDDHEYWILGNMRFSWKKGVFIMFEKANIKLIKWWILQTLLGGWSQPMGSKVTETKSHQWYLRCRGLADRSCPRGNSWNWPRPGAHALHGPEGYNAPECNSDRAQANHTGWGVGNASSLR